MPVKDNLVGNRYGKLLVVAKAQSVNDRARWDCLCDCGKNKTVDGGCLKKGSTKSCGCYAKERASETASKLRFKDLTGKQFHRLTVIDRHGTSSYGQATWNCVCECGTKKVIASQGLLHGLTKSCGCLHKEIMVNVGLSGRIYYDVESASKSSKRSTREYVQTPKWANINAIKKIYKLVPDGYEVDHIIPLCGKNVSGLHVETNLQYLSKSENRKKGNKLTEEHSSWHFY
jgi:hypothetical protein